MNIYTAKKATGYALIEVLISMVVMAIALKGIGDYWKSTVIESEHNYSRSQALSIAQNIIEFVRVNPEGWDVYRDSSKWITATRPLQSTPNQPIIPTSNCVSRQANALQPCTPQQMAEDDIQFIIDYVAVNMPLLNGSIELVENCSNGGGNPNDPNVSCVVIGWMDTTARDCNPLNDGTNLFNQDDGGLTPIFAGPESQCVIIDFIPEHA